MILLNELFRCNICGNVIEIVHEGVESLACCNEDMERLKVNEADSKNYHFAHVETVKKVDDIEYKQITFNHEMTPEHYIEFIEAISNDGVHLKRKYLHAGEPAVMTLKCACNQGFFIRLYCSRDGVWITKQ